MMVGQQIGPFEIEKELGSGAMGTVYRARFRKDDKIVPVALKVIAFGLLGNEAALARFDRESNILKQLKHPHIVRLYATGRYKQTPFIAMEYVDGESLDRTVARRGGRLGWEDVVAYGKQLCEALQHAHDKGIIHRDLKPSNLMVTKDGTLKLTDFGIAKDTDVTALTGQNSTIGTAAYMSPEQCRGERDLTNKSDLYSLGIVFYELVTGKKPFAAETTIEMFLKHVNEKPVRPSRLAPDLPIWLDNLILFLLEKDKTRRPLDASTVGRLLAEIEDKVRNQQSAGADVANARRMDRPVGEAPLDDADKDAARSLREGGSAGKKKKKKKKAVPFHEKTWPKAVGLGVLLFGIIGLAFYLMQPESLEAAYARVEKAESPEAKLAAVTEFLSRHGAKADPKVDQARDIYREALAREAERLLEKRFNSKFKGNSENFDEESYKLAVAAMEAEKVGNLKRAAELWGEVQAKQPPIAAEQMTDEDAVNRSRLGWVAVKRLKEIRQTVPDALRKLREQNDNDRLFEVVRTYDPKNPESVAVRGLRLEAFGDKPKAKLVWDGLAKETEPSPEARVWFLAASQQAAQITVAPTADAKADRIKLLETKLAKATTDWEAAQANPNTLVARREIRTVLRDIAALYDDETDDAIATVVKNAKTLLDAIGK